MSSELLAFRRTWTKLTPKKRLAALIERKDAIRAVRAMPVQDLYATVRDVGLEDSLEVLELCSPQQVRAFLDLDGWRGDRIDAPAIARWMQMLFNANPDRAVQQLRALDIELVTLLFKIHARVIDLTAEEDPGDDVGMHSITPDRRFMIVYGGIAQDSEMGNVLRQMVDRLLGRDPMFITHLCEAIRWELPSSLEEEALRWRTGRLEDLGFLPKDAASIVYAYFDPDASLLSPEAQARADVAAAAAAADDDGVVTDLSTSVLFPWDVFASGTSAFGKASEGLGEELREQIAQDVVRVANRAACADSADLGDAEAQRAFVKQVVDTIGLALAYKSAGDASQLSSLLSSTPALTLFRVGHSLGLKLQRELRTRTRAKDSGLDGNGLLLLDSPLREVAAGLLRPRPLLFAGLMDEKRLDYRAFSSLADLGAAARALSEMTFRAALFSPRVLGRPAIETGDNARAPTHGALLGAVLAHIVLGDADTTPRALDKAKVIALRSKLADAGAAIDAVVGAVVAKAPLPGAQSADEAKARTRAFADKVIAAMREEIAVATDAGGDFAALTSVWVG